MAETLASILGGSDPGGPLGRRTFLKLGGAGLVAAAGGTVWWAERRGVFDGSGGAAFEPWSDFSEQLVAGGARGVEDIGLALAMGAVLAASPHNSQPWLFSLESGSLRVFADLARSLGPLDPFLRELYVAQGCAIENLAVTAAGLGVAAEIRVVPDQDDLRLAASVTWDGGPAAPGASDDPLFRAIPARRTDRGPYLRGTPVPGRLLDEWARAAEAEEVTLRLLSAEGERSEFGRLVVDATEAMVSDPELTEVTREWIRERPDEIDRRRDGLTLDGQASGTVATAMAKLLPPPTPARIDEAWLRATRERHVGTADLFGVLAVDDPDDRGSQIACGRAWQRMHLLATAEGVAMHPMNQVVERAAREEATGLVPDFGPRLAEWTGRGRGLLCFRAGMPVKQRPPSPRRGAAQVLLD